MNNLESHEQLAHRIGGVAVKHYEECVSKHGKPQRGKEWTLMAAILLERREDPQKFGGNGLSLRLVEYG